MTALVDPSADDVPIVALTPDSLESWLAAQPDRVRAWVTANAFQPAAGRVLVLPGEDGELERVLYGLGDAPAGVWSWAALSAGLPPTWYALELAGPDHDSGGESPLERATLAWALAAYKFSRYKADDTPRPTLAWPEGCDRGHVRRVAEGIALARDLVNTPAEDLGPGELADALVTLAERHGARASVIVGDDLLDANYPMIHAVGRAASRAPRLADLVWGDESHPKVTLVGKGVIFDTGGLDLKSAEFMRIMKKDMGGAASVLGLAHMIMDAELPVRLRVLVPSVENSVAGNAFRPLDVIPTRKGLSVEIGNTDAEGRLVLCDALAEADTESPELVFDFATLTGAARVALGTELPALFCNDDAMAGEYLAAGLEVTDPLWRMPLHADYRRHLDSPVADLNNIGGSRYGGAITAALYLAEFVSPGTAWAHVDTMAWNEGPRPGRPVGGEAFGVRAAFRMLSARYSG